MADDKGEKAEHEALVRGAFTLFLLSAVFYIPLDLATSYIFFTSVGGGIELNPFFGGPMANCTTRLCILGVLGGLFLLKAALLGWFGFMLLVYRYDPTKEIIYSQLLLRVSLVSALLSILLVANNALFLWLYLFELYATWFQVALFLTFAIYATSFILGMVLNREPVVIAADVDLPVLLVVTLVVSFILWELTGIPYIAVSFAILTYGNIEVFRYYWEGGER